MKIALLIGVAVGLGVLWRWTPLGNWLDIKSVIATVEWIKIHPLAPLMVLTGYVALSLVYFPITLLILATVIVFGPWWGFGYALIGSVLSALATFWVGHLLGKNNVSQLSGGLINRINRQLSDAGMIAVITFRIIPVAPFSVINLVAGISAISLKDFGLGTLIGMLPGITAIALVTDRFSESLRQPDVTSFTLLFAIVAFVGLSLVGLRKWLAKSS